MQVEQVAKLGTSGCHSAHETFFSSDPAGIRSLSIIFSRVVPAYRRVGIKYEIFQIEIPAYLMDLYGVRGAETICSGGEIPDFVVRTSLGPAAN